MKTRHFIPLISILFLAACQPVELEFTTPDVVKEGVDAKWTLTVQATKGNPGTKALALTDDGKTLNAGWKDGEKVAVYLDGVFLGVLTATPGSDNTIATLSGSLESVEGVSESTTLMLLFPGRDDKKWDYTGQAGVLTGTASIEDTYDYAKAEVTVSTLDADSKTITTTTATFANQQSIYRFGFKAGDDYIAPKDFTISANGGKLAQSMSYESSAWTAVYGSLTVTPAAAPSDNFYYVSLRNDGTSDDTYSFIITGSDDALYLASKPIPASVLDVPGKFISAKSITATQPDFSAQSSGTIEDAGGVL